MTVLYINGRVAEPHKATKSPNLGSRTVLTDSHWEYVSLWLRREKSQMLYCTGYKLIHSHKQLKVCLYPQPPTSLLLIYERHKGTSICEVSTFR